MLVSFNHPVGVMLDGRAILVGCAICTEIFDSATVSVTPKKEATRKPTPAEAMTQAQSLTLDFPLGLRIVSLADGKALRKPIDIMVKWNNISALCNLPDEAETKK